MNMKYDISKTIRRCKQSAFFISTSTVNIS